MLVRPWLAGDQRQIEQQLDSEFISLADIKAFLRRYLLSILVFLTGGIAAAMFYVVTTDPIYSASAQILIEPKLPQYLQQTGGVTTSLDTAQIESQIAVMRSEKIARMVIDYLHLMEHPDFFVLRGVTLPMRIARFAGAALGTVGLKPSDLPGFLQRLIPDPTGVGSGPDPAAALSEFERGRIAIDIFGGNIDIRRVGVSYAVAIFYNSRNPDLAAQIANATADSFVREQIETKAAAARQGGEWLEQRMGEMRAKMNTATQIAQEFRSRHDYRVKPPGASLVNGQVVYDDTAEPHDGPTLEELEVTADTYRQMYESFLLSFTNNLSQQSYPVADARVITAATRPLAPSQPRRKLVLAFGMMAGLAGGVSVAFLRQVLDRKLRSPRQIRDQFGLKCLGELPPTRTRAGGFGHPDEVLVAPSSTFSQSLRRAKFALRLDGQARPVRRIGIASALSDEGKSMVASNLALLYALSGNRTLLVDADPDFSVLTEKLLGRPADAPGSGIVLDALRGVDLLPGGGLVPTGAPQLPETDDYDVTIVALPPLAAGPERLAIAAQLDGVLLVAEWGLASIEVTAELVGAVQAYNAPIFGVLLTKVRHMSANTYRRSIGPRAAFPTGR